MTKALPGVARTRTTVVLSTAIARPAAPVATQIVSASAELFTRTFLIGIVVAAPVGAMGVLCIQRTLAHGWRAGIATGAGIAGADAMYAALAAFGVTAISQGMVSYQAQLKVVGGIALLWLGWRALRSPPAGEAARAIDSPRLLPLFTSAVGLTLTNPMTIMAFAAVFASAGLITQAGAGSAAVVTIGVACGSLTWWLALTTGVTAVRHAVSPKVMLIVNRSSGGVISRSAFLPSSAASPAWCSALGNAAHVPRYRDPPPRRPHRAASAIVTSPASTLNTIRISFSTGIDGGLPMINTPSGPTQRPYKEV